MGVHPFDIEAGPLPRGRRNLSREEVLASQHGRMLAAMTEAVADKGYAEATVADVIERARVSRKTFYDSFANKEDCFAAAYEAATDVLTTAVADAVEAHSENLHAALRSGMRAYCETLAANSAMARAFVLESVASRQVRALRTRALASWADLFEMMARNAGQAAPPLAGMATVGAITHILAVYLEENRDLCAASETLADTAYRLLTDHRM